MTKRIKELKRSKVLVNLLSVAAVLVAILVAIAAGLVVVGIAAGVVGLLGIGMIIVYFIEFVNYVSIKKLTGMSKKELTSKIKLENYAKKYIELKLNDNIYNGICPACKEQSFNIYPNQIFDCNKCYFRGDLFDFVKKIDGLTFNEALQKINAELKTIEKSTANPL